MSSLPSGSLPIGVPSASRGHRALAATALATAIAVVAACDVPTTPTLAPHTLYQPLEGACPADDAILGRGEFVSEVTELAVTITAPDLPSPVEARGTGTITIEDVPAGEGRTVGLFGLAGGQSVWRAVSRPITLTAGETTTVDLLMARVADLSCARTTVGRPAAFHTATALDDGRVLVVGGADVVDASAVCPGCLRATGNNGASVYDPKTGTFEAISGLTDARFFHTAAKLADGRVVVAGGTGSALLRPVDAGLFPFPIEPTAPLASVEIFDPSIGGFQSAGALPDGNARVFAAATATVDGEVIITGGVPGAATPNNLGNALATTVICGGSTVSCRPGPPLAKPRAGHMIFSAAPGGTFIWGGSVDIAGNGFQVENLRPGESTFALIDVANMQATRNLFFASGTQYVGGRFLAAGGIIRKEDGTFSTVDSQGNFLSKRAYVLDFLQAASGSVSASLELGSGRIFGTAAGLPDRSTAVVAGGFLVGERFGDFGWVPTAELEIFSEDPFALRALSVGGNARVLREPRGGATATAVGDGTVVFVGGYAGSSNTVETAEVFADPKDPPQVAGVSQ